MRSEMVDCPQCLGMGTIHGAQLCNNCGGRGEVASHLLKRMLPSNSPREVYFRGARINTTRKGTKS